MKTQKNKNQKSLTPLVCLLVVLVVIAIALAVALIGKGNNPDVTNTETQETGTTASDTDNSGAMDSTEAVSAPSVTAPQEDVQIETPYGTLYYPGDWEAFLAVETSQEQGYSVTFIAKLDTEGIERTQKLFKLTFDGSSENFIGTLQREDGSTVAVDLEIFEFKPDETWNDSEINIVFTMQDAVNHMLNFMPLERSNGPAGNMIEESDEAMDLDTPHGKLHYPARWEKYLTLKTEAEDPYTLTFCCKLEGHEEQPLFTIYFGGEQGVSAMTIVDSNGETVEIRLDITSFEPDDTWSADETSIVYAMQEDLNFLLEKLR